MKSLRFCASFLVALLLCSCATSPLTVVPRPVVAAQASYDGNSATSGILAAAPDGGFVVTPHFVARWRQMAGPGALIDPPTAPGGYLVTAEQMAQFLALNRKRKAGAP